MDANTELLGAGFGANYLKEETTILQMKKIQLVECTGSQKSKPNEFCTTLGPCSGDSGGPLWIKGTNEVVGIVNGGSSHSSGGGDCNKDTPVYADVFGLRKFITDTIGSPGSPPESSPTNSPESPTGPVDPTGYGGLSTTIIVIIVIVVVVVILLIVLTVCLLDNPSKKEEKMRKKPDLCKSQGRPAGKKAGTVKTHRGVGIE